MEGENPLSYQEDDFQDMRVARKAIDVWESKVVELKKEPGEERITWLKASSPLEMLPDQVRLTVAQGMRSKKLECDALKAKTKPAANSNSSANGHWRDAVSRRGRER